MNNDEIIALIKEALAEVAPTRTSDFAAIQMDTKIEDLGLDSIATMEMVNAIEERVDSTPADVSASAAGVAGLGFRTPCAAETPDRSEAPATQGTPG
jgi:acyl carrier protein